MSGSDGPSVIWKAFDWIQRLWTDITGYADSVVRMVRQMWEESPVSAGIVAFCAVVSLILLVILVRLTLRALSRARRRLIRATVSPARRARRRRRILRRITSAPELAVTEYETVARASDRSSATLIARKAPAGTPLKEHLQAISALLTLQASLLERKELTGEAVILDELHSHLPELCAYLLTQMRHLALIQRSAGGQPLNRQALRSTEWITEAARTTQLLQKISREMPKLIDHSLASGPAGRTQNVALDLESLAATITQVLDTGREPKPDTGREPKETAKKPRKLAR